MSLSWILIDMGAHTIAGRATPRQVDLGCIKSKLSKPHGSCQWVAFHHASFPQWWTMIGTCKPNKSASTPVTLSGCVYHSNRKQVRTASSSRSAVLPWQTWPNSGGLASKGKSERLSKILLGLFLLYFQINNLWLLVAEVEESAVLPNRPA